MKTLVSALACAAIVFTGCQNDFSRSTAKRGGDDLVLRAHFVGSQQLLKDRNAPSLNNIWNLKSSAELRNRALDRFATLPFLWLSNALPKNAPNQAALLRPILDDALAHESLIEWHASAFTLAAKLPEARAKDWDSNLRRVVAGWKLGNPAILNRPGTSGWHVKQAGTELRLVRAEGWTAISVGPSAESAESNALVQARQFAARTGAWLEGDANLAEWKGRLPILDGFSNLPSAHFSLSNRADFVRTMVQLKFPKPHQWKSEPWQMPTNLIFDPLMNFTVARGVAPVFEGLPMFHNLGLRPTPNQVCGWGIRDFPFQVNYAVPARDASRQFKSIEPRLRAEISRALGPSFVGSLVLSSNQLDLAWRGLPLAVPNVVDVKATNGEFAVLSFFPMPRLKDPPPAELFAQIARDDLVLYDWESTPHRMNTWRQVYQLGEIGSHRALTPTNAIDQRWQTDIVPQLRDSVTELQVASPTQMTLVRKSSIGLTAFELVTLSRWIDSSSFPAFGVFPPQPVKKAPAKAGARR